MDLRIRLLVSLSPLLVALAIIGGVALYSQQRVAAAVAAVDRSARNLVEVAQGESLILLEQYYVSEIINGHQASRSELDRIRPEVQRFFGEYASVHEGFVELELVARVETMIAQHDAALTFLDRGDLQHAQELLRSVDYHRNIRAIHSLAVGAQREYEVQYLARIAALERIINEGFWIAATIVSVSIAIALGLAVSLIWQVGKSVDRLTFDAEQLAKSDTYGVLSQISPINQLQRLRDAFQHLIDANYRRQQQLTAVLQAQQAQLEREVQLQSTIRALSLPVTALGPQTIFLPLVGYLDAERSAQLEQTVLNAIQQRRARAVVIDVHGLATVDAATIQTLIRVGRGAQLLGATAVLVGVRPEQALTFTELPSGLFRYARDIPSALSLVS